MASLWALLSLLRPIRNKSSVPQADSAVAAPEKIQLNFSENLTVKFSGAKLTMTGMKGMSSHSPMPVAAKVAPGADPKSMVIIPRAFTRWHLSC